MFAWFRNCESLGENSTQTQRIYTATIFHFVRSMFCSVPIKATVFYLCFFDFPGMAFEKSSRWKAFEILKRCISDTVLKVLLNEAEKNVLERVKCTFETMPSSSTMTFVIHNSNCYRI